MLVDLSLNMDIMWDETEGVVLSVSSQDEAEEGSVVALNDLLEDCLTDLRIECDCRVTYSIGHELRRWASVYQNTGRQMEDTNVFQDA